MLNLRTCKTNKQLKRRHIFCGFYLFGCSLFMLWKSFQGVNLVFADNPRTKWQKSNNEQFILRWYICTVHGLLPDLLSDEFQRPQPNTLTHPAMTRVLGDVTLSTRGAPLDVRTWRLLTPDSDPRTKRLKYL